MNKVFSRKKPIWKLPHLLFHYFSISFLAVLLCSCGYTNHYVQKSPTDIPESTILLTTWQNRTNELGLESVYFRLLNNWFKRSGRVSVLFDKDSADLKLTGEISSIDLPGLFYDSFDEALEIKIRLTVSFTLYDNQTDRILWQEKNYTVYEPFLLDPSGKQTEFNKKRALLHIGDEIGELIYLKVHEIVTQRP